MSSSSPARKQSVVRYRNSLLPLSIEDHKDTCRVDLELRSGELMLVLISEAVDYFGLVDAAQGLVLPEEGAVSFMDRPWGELSPREQDELRATIGRVFADRGWVSNLSVLENILLRQRHHNAKREDELTAEVEQLTALLGLTESLLEEPERTPKTVLHRAAWVRAFLGEPPLLLLEEPLKGLALKHLPALTELVDRSRARGAAVLWLTKNPGVWRHESLSDASWYRLKDGELLPEEQ